MKNNKAIIYCRCSTDLQDLNYQIEACTKYANANDLNVIEVIQDFGVSAFSTEIKDRIGLNKVLDYAKDKMFNTLLVTEASRISRQHLQGQVIIKSLSDMDITVISVTEGVLNTTDIDNLLNSVRFFTSELESRKTSQRIRLAKEEMKKNRLWLGNHLPIFGYTIDKDKKIIVNEKEREIVQDFFQSYISYGNKYTVAYMKEKYNINIKRCNELIVNQIFIGRPYKSDLDLYFPELQIISDSTWKQTQNVIQNRRTKGNTITDKTNCICESIIYHSCGKKMYISKDKNNKYTYYRCKCNSDRKNYTQYKVDNIVNEKVSKWFECLSQEELLKRFNNQRSLEYKKLLVVQTRQKELLSVKNQTLKNGMNKLNEAILKDLSLDMINILTDNINDLKTAIEGLEEEIKRIDEKIIDEENLINKELKISKELLNFKRLYQHATLLEKKKLIRLIVNKIIISDDYNIYIEYRY